MVSGCAAACRDGSVMRLSACSGSADECGHMCRRIVTSSVPADGCQNLPRSK